MSKIITAAAVAALLVAPAALAKDKKPVDPNKKVCRSEVPTGSMMAKSTCHTAAQWADIDAANAAAARTSLDHATRGAGAGQ